LQSGWGQSYNESMTTSTDNLVTLAELSTDMEAAMIIAALEREGIEAFMKGEFTAGFRAEAPSWPKVEVRESDYERARTILDSFEAKQDTELDDLGESEESRSTSAWPWICKALVIAYLVAFAFLVAWDLIRLLGLL
jgi:hypothetical protein